ncbi:dienelactone hydrolase family protein [Sphingobium sp.]|uniref:dienelactone hydrolase family protein n=1 Tax=Sphingobium sp. TaxID=1912891 RepID=UPI0028BE6228|nr:dienelactone hydrolase family protein [Sphingobium sp.]
MKEGPVEIQLRDGKMSGWLAQPNSAPKGAVIAIMEIWGVNDTMREHAREFAEQGYVCLVPDLFWRQEPGVELSDRDPADVEHAFDLYYGFDYDLGVRDMKDCEAWLKEFGGLDLSVGAVGYCLGGKLCYMMCCRTDIACAVAYYGTYIEHEIREAGNLHRPFLLHMAMKDRWVQREVNDLLVRRLSPNPLVSIHQYPEADHAFARHGGLTYRKVEADEAFALTLSFFDRHLAKVEAA